MEEVKNPAPNKVVHPNCNCDHALEAKYVCMDSNCSNHKKQRFYCEGCFLLHDHGVRPIFIVVKQEYDNWVKFEATLKESFAKIKGEYLIFRDIITLLDIMAKKRKDLKGDQDFKMMTPLSDSF